MQPLKPSLFALAGALAGLFVSLTACSPTITEQQVLAILDSTDKAAKERNADGVIAHMAEKAVIRVSIQGPGGIQSLSFVPKEYKQHLEQTFRGAQEYSYTRTDTKISIAPNQQTATVSSQVLEIVRLPGQVLSSVSQETATFEVHNRKVVIASVEASVEVPLPAGLQALKDSKLREALDHFRKAVTHTPSFAAAHGLRGMAAELLGEFEEALESYRSLVQLEPSAENHFRLGMLTERMGSTNLSVQSLQTSLSAAQHGGEGAADYLFRVFVESGDRARALELAKARGWLREGANYCDQGQAGVSNETQVLLAMLVHPRRADCLLPLGMALTEAGLVDLARLVLLDRIQNSPSREVREKAQAFLRHRLPAQNVAKRAESLNIIGYNLQNRFKNNEEAIKVYQKAIAADPSFSWPYHNIGQVHVQRGEIPEAMDWYRKAITVNPNHWKAQYNLGWLAHQLNRYDEAFMPLRQAVALNPDDAAGHFYFGRLLLSLGREAEGIRELRIAVQLDPRVRQDPEFPKDKL